MSLRIFTAIAALSLTVVACSPESAPPDLSRDYDAETKMGAIQEAGALRVGLPTESEPFASSDDSPSGFSVDMANWVADTLGVEMEPVRAPSKELIQAVLRDEVDIAFPLLPVTEELVRTISFTNLYYVGHQRLLVPQGSGVRQVDDLGGETACTYILDTGVGLDELAPVGRATAVRDPAACGDRLARGVADVAVGPDVLLMGMAARAERRDGRTYQLAGDHMTTDGYAAALTPESPGFVSFVNSVFNRSVDEGDWRTSFRNHLMPYSDQDATPPDLSLEDAAALYPTGLKIDTQG